MNFSELKSFLDYKASTYESSDFIETDPISIPHQFSKKEDIEISSFLIATIAWGQRKTIIKNGQSIIEKMDKAPSEFIHHFTEDDLAPFESFKHRTFNAEDLIFFFKSLQNIYQNHGGLENIFSFHPNDMKESIAHFRTIFFEIDGPDRTQKHVSNTTKGSSAKRINMFLRWMVRPSTAGVDFGIWKKIEAKHLMLPLDVHTGNVGRKLNLLNRKQNDWKSVQEISDNLRKFDANDPIKYDFALFGLGAFEDF